MKNKSPDVRINSVVYGRVLVRAIESLEAIAEHNGSFGWLESATRRICLSAYRHNLRRLVAELPSELVAEILAASDGALSKLPSHDLSLN